MWNIQYERKTYMKEKHKLMYMEMAEIIAKQSYAKRLQVGSVAVKDNRIISIGYNGTPPGMDNNCEEYYEDVEYKDGNISKVKKQRTKKEVIHAEMNLIYKLARDGESGKGADLFITHSPCFECSKAILSVGFRSVYYRDEYRDQDGSELLKTNGVYIEQMS